jgi:2-oxoisovalerate dehydrogenase E1 component alpha subunit
MQHVRTDLDPVAGPQLSDDVVLGIFSSLVRIEAFSAAERSRDHSDENHVRQTLTRGEEAALAGGAAAARPEDALFPSHVDVSVALARGAKMSDVAARSVAWKSIKVAPPGWHNGAQMTHASGYAWAAKMRHDELVAIAFAAENGLETGELHNALNFAGVFKLPVIFVIRVSHTPEAELRGRAAEYGINVALTDGGDPIATCKTVRDARARAVSGGGATMIGALIDPNDKRDASLVLRRHIEAAKIASREAIEKIIEDGAREAAASFDEPSVKNHSSIVDNVFASPPWFLKTHEHLEK